MEEIEEEFALWLDENHRRFRNLTDAVLSITTNLMTERQLNYLSITGRTKDKQSCIGKIKRKAYDNPKLQMTDISGIRIIVFFESDIERVSQLIRESFRVDEANSSNADSRMSPDQVGYRSVHYVCDLGPLRSKLPEFAGLQDLNFEFQVRTVLQHAWAELAHDRNYKFTGKLPRPMERKLFLLAGLLETADQGIEDLSTQIDHYVDEVNREATQGSLAIEVNTLSVFGFVEQWAKDNGVSLFEPKGNTRSERLIREMTDFGIKTLADLKEIIPPNYANLTKEDEQTVLGIVRRWMLISDPDKFVKKVKVDWKLSPRTMRALKRFLPEEKTDLIATKLIRMKD